MHLEDFNLCLNIFEFQITDFCNIHKKTLVLESLFNEVAGLNACNFIKKRLQHKFFPVNIAKFFRTAILVEHLCWLLMYMSSVYTSSYFRNLFVSTAFELLRKISLLMNSQFFKTLKVLKTSIKALEITPRYSALMDGLLTEAATGIVL